MQKRPGVIRAARFASLVVPALFGLLDVRYPTTQLLHVDRTQQLELFLAPDIRLRPEQRPAESRLGRLANSRYRSVASFYTVLAAVLLVVAAAM
jgi:hypothetical protein